MPLSFLGHSSSPPRIEKSLRCHLNHCWRDLLPFLRFNAQLGHPIGIMLLAYHIEHPLLVV